MVHPCPAWGAAKFRLMARLMISVCAVVLAASPRVSSAQQVFTVPDVVVDATAETAAAARVTALAQGQSLAFRRLLERLTLRADYGRLPSAKEAGLDDLVRDFQIEEEKTSAVRYLARLKIRFKPGAIRHLLRSSNIPFAETISKPVLVLPVYDIAGALSLWDEPNPWRDAWARLPARDSLVPLVVPLGDLADIADIGAEQAVKGDMKRLGAIARRYAAADSLVAVATLRMAALANLTEVQVPMIQINVTRIGGASLGRTIIETFTAETPDGLLAMLAKAVRNIADQVEEMWKQDNLIRIGRKDVLTAELAISKLADWLKAKKLLRGITFIRRSDLVYLSRNKAVVRLQFNGDQEQLKLALAQSDLLLSQGPTSWVLSLGGAQPSSTRP